MRSARSLNESENVKRRLAKVAISHELLQAFLRGQVTACRSNAPDDIEIVRVTDDYDIPRQFFAIVRSKEFEVVPDGQAIPSIGFTFSRLD